MNIFFWGDIGGKIEKPSFSCLERREQEPPLSDSQSFKVNRLMIAAPPAVLLNTPGSAAESAALARTLLQRLNQPTHRVGHKEGPLLPADHLARVFGHPPPFSREEKDYFKKLLVVRFNDRQRSRPSVRRIEELERLRREKEEEREARYGKNGKKSKVRREESESGGQSDSDEERPTRSDGRGGAGDVRGGNDTVSGGVRYGAVRGSVNPGQDVQARY